MKLRKALVVYALLVIGLLAGCSGDDEEKGTGPELNPGVPEVLVGTWTFRSVTLDGVSVPLAIAFGWEVNSVSCWFTVNGEGAFVYEELSSDSTAVYTQEGTMSANGNSITVSPPIAGLVSSATWTVNGTWLELVISDSGGYRAVVIAGK